MACALALLTPPCSAQIVVDGTLGPAGALSGPTFAIPDTLGTQVGSNLFHSFSDFNVRAGESATFTSSFAGTTTNVISRVTGPQASIIDGALRSEIAGADFWFINPQGLVIGPTATLSVPGSFYAGGADALLLQDGGRFVATDPSGSSLTVSPPAAFGFLDGTPGALTLGAATLQVPAGKTLALVGGDLTLTGTRLNAPNGRIELHAVTGTGAVALRGATPPGTRAAALGALTLSGQPAATSGGGTGWRRRWWWWRRHGRRAARSPTC